MFYTVLLLSGCEIGSLIYKFHFSFCRATREDTQKRGRNGSSPGIFSAQLTSYIFLLHFLTLPYRITALWFSELPYSLNSDLEIYADKYRPNS